MLGFLDHMVSLPFTFFQTRNSGDLMMRVNSNSQMRELITSSTMSAMLDGTLVLIYLGMILAISPSLGALVVGLSVVQASCFYLARSKYREYMTSELEVQAKTQSYLVQLVAGIETLKVAGAEAQAVQHWSNLFAKSTNVGLERARLQALVESMLGMIKAAAPLSIMAYGAVLAMRGEITLGTMLALNSLANGFLGPMGALVDNAVALQGMKAYIKRIDDVLKEKPEQDRTKVKDAPRLNGHIRITNVTFRYSKATPPVIRNASVEIHLA